MHKTRSPQTPGLRRLCGLAFSGLLLAVAGCTSLPPKTADVPAEQAGTVNVSGADGQVSATAERKALQGMVNEGKKDLAIHHLKTLVSTGEADLYRGNRTRLLIDGPATFGAMKAAIAQARGRVLLQSYIVEDEGVAAEVAELLLARAAQGVKVSMIYDSVGSISTPEAFFKRLVPVHQQQTLLGVRPAWINSLPIGSPGKIMPASLEKTVTLTAINGSLFQSMARQLLAHIEADACAASNPAAG